MSRLTDSRFGVALGASGMLARRRARHDLPQLLTTAALVAVTTLLSIVAPGIMLDTLDKGAQDLVARAGNDADLLALVTVGETGPGSKSTTPTNAIGVAERMPGQLPESLAAVYGGSALTVISSEVRVRTVDGIEPSGGNLIAQIAMLTPDNTEAIELVAGALPGARFESSEEPIQIVISEETAAASGLELGSVFDLGDPQPEPTPEELEELEVLEALEGPQPVLVTRLQVVGIVAKSSDATDDQWVDSPEIWSPLDREPRQGIPAATRFTVLASPDGITAAYRFLEYPLVGTVRMHLVPELFTSDLAGSTVAEAKALVANGQDLAVDTTASVSVRANVTNALATYPRQSRAALAQMSLMMAGVLGIAAVALVLLSRLLLQQRTATIALERARGASVLSIGLRSILESLVVTAAGATVGIVAALLVMPGGLRDILPITVVVLVALLAGPLQAMALARAMWTGRRDPANRRDRHLLARKRRLQRLVIEGAVIAIAAGALVSIRARGLLQNRTSGIDPLLIAAPLLLAIAVTIIVIRIYPYPVRAIGALAQRTRGVLGLLGSVRARSAIAALPLLALALGSSLSVTGAMLLDSVRDGQTDAAWERVGADARVDFELEESMAEALRDAPGVETVSATRSRGGVSLNLGTTTTTVTIIGIDESYADVVDAIPGQPSSDSLRELMAEETDGEVLPVVVDQATSDRLIRDEIAMYFGPAYITLKVVGTSAVAPSGYIEGPFAFVDRDALVALLPEPQLANRYLVMGEGAANAVESLDIDQADVLTWDEWIADRRDLALVGGVQGAMVFAVAAVALLSIVSLIATVIGGARARGRALSMLRTLGMSSRLGWWLALAELGPLIAAAILGGIGAGVIVTASLAPAIGLDVLAGGTTVPAMSVSAVVFIALAAAGVLLLALGTIADVLVHRRDKLSEVLRVGETV